MTSPRKWRPPPGADVAAALPQLAEGPRYRRVLLKISGEALMGRAAFGLDPATVDLATALALLSLPRIVGADPESGEAITAQNGRFGPYLKKGTDSRSLESEQQIFDIGLPAALEIFAQPKYGARRASSALKEFEADPVSGKPIRIRDGRFGPYVTDGETNATIPRGEDVEAVDFERAVQLLADKRAKGPAKPKSGARRTTTRRTAAKK